MHLKEHIEKQFKCEKCNQEFHLKWRFNKHQEGHENTNVKYCHYFNNKKECPFQELGCMYKHSAAPVCKYKSSCNRKLCQFTHKIAENSGIIQTPSIIYACSKCDAKLRSVEQLEAHIEQNHQMDEKEKKIEVLGVKYVTLTTMI